MEKSKEVVFPGSILAAEEEFSPGKNTYVDEKGEICSDSIGYKEIDTLRHEVIVDKKTKSIDVLQEGAIVTGIVSLVKEKMALIDIIEATKNDQPLVLSNTYAMLPIFDTKDGFVKNMQDVYRIGDIIKAKVTKLTNYSIDLSTKDPHFGVVKAFCVKCRAELQLFGSELKCVKCGNNEERKVSKNYFLK